MAANIESRVRFVFGLDFVFRSFSVSVIMNGRMDSQRYLARTNVMNDDAVPDLMRIYAVAIYHGFESAISKKSHTLYLTFPLVLVQFKG